MKQHLTILVISLPVIMAVRATITMDTQDTIARALVDILPVTATVITVCKIFIFHNPFVFLFCVSHKTYLMSFT